MPPAGFIPTWRPVELSKSRIASSITRVTGIVAAGVDLARRGLDEVGAGGHRQDARTPNVVVRLELAGLEDDLEMGVAGRLLDLDDLLEDGQVVTREECATVDDHVDFVGARGRPRPGPPRP